MKIKGRVFLLTDKNGDLIKDIDTDQIYHNAYLHITDINEMGKYALGNLEGYENFPELVKENDILIAGHNFGAGSSRQQAVDCFRALKVGAILAPSFGAIYRRNAINSAFPIIECPGIEEYIEKGLLKHGEQIELDFEDGVILKEDGTTLPCKKPSPVQIDIFKAGGLFEYGKTVSS